jgi:hypothetical protein
MIGNTYVTPPELSSKFPMDGKHSVPMRPYPVTSWITPNVFKNRDQNLVYNFANLMIIRSSIDRKRTLHTYRDELSDNRFILTIIHIEVNNKGC